MTIAGPDKWWRTPAIWMALLAGGLQLVNAARAFGDPIGFATYLGLPLLAEGDGRLVHVYGLRALFIGALVILLVVARQRRALMLLALAAVVMPLGDVVLAAGADAASATIARHTAIAVYLLVTALLLSRIKSTSV